MPSFSRSARIVDRGSAAAVILKRGFARVLGLRAIWRVNAGDDLPLMPKPLSGCMKASLPPIESGDEAAKRGWTSDMAVIEQSATVVKDGDCNDDLLISSTLEPS